MPLIDTAVAELDRIVGLAVGARTEGGAFGMANVKAEVLAAYASYKIQEANLAKITESNQANLNMLQSAINELRVQARWSKWLAIATTILAVGTVALAVLTYLR